MLNQVEALKIYDNVMNTQGIMFLLIILFLLFAAEKIINIYLNRKRLDELKKFRQELIIKKNRIARHKRE